MIICHNCGAMNSDDALTCSECMVLLDKDKIPKDEIEDKSPKSESTFGERFAKSVSAVVDNLQKKETCRYNVCY